MPTSPSRTPRSKAHARSTRRDDILGWAHNALRIFASAAALILFGFAVGWMGHDRMHGIPVINNPGAVNTSPLVPAGFNAAGPGYEVTFYDPTGKPVAVMKFDTKEEAERFVRDAQAAQNKVNPPAFLNDLNGVPNPGRF